jgi:hypothetical protein
VGEQRRAKPQSEETSSGRSRGRGSGRRLGASRGRRGSSGRRLGRRGEEEKSDWRENSPVGWIV